VMQTAYGMRHMARGKQQEVPRRRRLGWFSELEGLLPVSRLLIDFQSLLATLYF